LELVGVTQGALPKLNEPLVLVEPKPGCFGFARAGSPNELVPLVMGVILIIEEFPASLAERLGVQQGSAVLVQLCGFEPPAGTEFCVARNQRRFLMHELPAGTRALVVQRPNGEFAAAHTERVLSVSAVGQSIFDEALAAQRVTTS